MGLQQISVGLVILTGGLFLAVQAASLAVLWRRRRARGTGVPLGVEAAWTLVPALLLAWLLLVAGGAAPARPTGPAPFAAGDSR